MGLLDAWGTGIGGVSFDCTRDIPSLQGKVILVTGGTNGLGREAIVEFARHGPAQIYLAARDIDRARITIAEIQKEVPDAPPIEPLVLDLASRASVKEAAKSFVGKSRRLDILMLNAGIMAPPHDVTQDGYEIQFGTNHVGHALLTKLLLPTLLRTTEQYSPDVRVVVLTSAFLASAPTAGINFGDLKTASKGTSSLTLYGQSKLANALFAREMARRCPQLKVSAIHPGAVATNLGRPLADTSMFLKGLFRLVPVVIPSVRHGVKNQMWGSVAKEVVSGEFYLPVGQVGHVWGVRR